MEWLTKESPEPEIQSKILVMGLSGDVVSCLILLSFITMQVCLITLCGRPPISLLLLVNPNLTTPSACI